MHSRDEKHPWEPSAGVIFLAQICDEKPGFTCTLQDTVTVELKLRNKEFIYLECVSCIVFLLYSFVFGPG